LPCNFQAPEISLQKKKGGLKEGNVIYGPVVASHGGKDDGGVDELGSNEMKKVTNTCLLLNLYPKT
jgi:hypothetical protein